MTEHLKQVIVKVRLAHTRSIHLFAFILWEMATLLSHKCSAIKKLKAAFNSAAPELLLLEQS